GRGKKRKIEQRPACGGAAETPARRAPEPGFGAAPGFGGRGALLGAGRRPFAVPPGAVWVWGGGVPRAGRPGARRGGGGGPRGGYAAQTGGKVYTVDCDPAGLEVCRRLTQPYAAAIEYAAADSVTFLRGWSGGPIDLLYLDSLDYLEGQEEASEAHHLAEVEA